MRKMDAYQCKCYGSPHSVDCPEAQDRRTFIVVAKNPWEGSLRIEAVDTYGPYDTETEAESIASRINAVNEDWQAEVRWLSSARSLIDVENMVKAVLAFAPWNRT